jgi:hypothetical protein
LPAAASFVIAGDHNADPQGERCMPHARCCATAVLLPCCAQRAPCAPPHPAARVLSPARACPDGNSYQHAIRQLLDCPRVTAAFTPQSEGGREAGNRHAGDRCACSRRVQARRVMTQAPAG